MQLVQTRLIDAHVFLTLEMDGNLDGYHERRRTVLQVTNLQYTPVLLWEATIKKLYTHNM